jgi:small-conductance mechanosensitive channel
MTWLGAFRVAWFLLTLCGGLGLPLGQAAAQAPQTPSTTTPPAKVQELIKLLDDPEIRAWLQNRPGPETADGGPAAVERISQWEAIIRGRFGSLYAAIPRLGSEMANAATVVTEKVNQGRPGTVIGIVVLLIAIGYGAEWLFRRAILGAGRQRRDPSAVQGRDGNRLIGMLIELGALLAFVVASAGLFLAFEWPPLLGQIVLTYLLAFVAFRVLTKLGQLLLVTGVQPDPVSDDRSQDLTSQTSEETSFWTRRLRLFVGYFLFGWATVGLMPLLEFSPDVTRLVVYFLGLGLLAMAIEMVWRRPRMKAGASSVKAWLLTAYLVVLWLFWVADAKGLLWIGLYALLLPKLVAGIGMAAQSLANMRGSATLAGTLMNVLIVRGVRALVIAAAMGWLMFIARSSPTMVAMGLSAERFVQGMLNGVVVLLVADLLWQLSKAFIGYKLNIAATKDGASADEMARRARLRTLLPIFRNALAAFIGVVAVLTVLSGLGVQIAPVIAGAGIFGVAIGFGSQTLVKDVLSGVFFMLDDAFRVGEYIESGSYMGTVESFSLRSVRLRHHRGPIFTVPFGDLGAVKNLSRDWVIEKMSINVTYDTDIELARKLVKQIGRELAEDPEFKNSVIEPLKMQGVDSFGDFAMVVKLKMMTKPGEQFTMKRKALLMIRKAFEENGIKIAVPTVHVSGGDDEAAVAAASETIRMRKAAEAASAAG